MKKEIYYSLLNQDNLDMCLIATNKGLCFIGSIDDPYEESVIWLNKHFSNYQLIKNDELLKPYANELIEYFNNERQVFKSHYDLKGTPFQLAVWEVLKQIPYGVTYSYSDIAKIINKPKASRAVGKAIGANPILIMIPCHRVIGKSGSLTGFRSGLELKRQLLDLENIKYK